MATLKNLEYVEEASTSTRTTNESGFFEDPPEELLTVVEGTCGYWRVIVIIIFCISMAAYGLHIFSMPFLHPRTVKFNCTQNKAEQNKINPCYILNGSVCTNFSFHAGQGYTITEKYVLICDNGLRIQVINIAFKFGMVVGYIFFGILSDKYGRKNLFTISVLSQLVIGVLLSAHTKYWFYTMFQSLHGMFLAGMTLISTILTCDISSNKYRTFNMGLLCMSISIGHILLPYVWIQIFEDPKSLSILYCLHFFIVFFICCVKESPTWLLCKNQTADAENVMLLVSRLNRVKRSNFRIRPVQITHTGSKAAIHLFDMLKVSTRNMVLALFLIWFFMFVIYSAIKNSNFIEIKDQIERTKIMGGVGLCAATLSILLCYIFKHKITIALVSLLTCSISIATYVVSKQDIKDESMVLTLQLSSYGISKLLTFAVFNMTSRVFPTELRGRGTAVAFVIGLFSYSTADIIFEYCLQLTLAILSIIVSICVLIILLATTFLYSTHNRELPDLLEDSVRFNRNYKPVRWTTIRPLSPTLDEVAIKVIDFEKGTSVSVPYKKGNSSKQNKQNKATQN